MNTTMPPLGQDEKPRARSAATIGYAVAAVAVIGAILYFAFNSTPVAPTSQGGANGGNATTTLPPQDFSTGQEKQIQGILSATSTATSTGKAATTSVSPSTVSSILSATSSSASGKITLPSQSQIQSIINGNR